MQREERIGVSGEGPVVLEVIAGIFGGLANVDPMTLESRGEPVDGGETETEQSGDSSAEKRMFAPLPAMGRARHADSR